MIWKLKSKITRRKSHTDLAILYDSSQLVHDSLMDVGLADHGVVLVEADVQVPWPGWGSYELLHNYPSQIQKT